MSNALDITPKNNARIVETGNNIILMSNAYKKSNLIATDKECESINNIQLGNNLLNIANYMYITDSAKLFARHKFCKPYKDNYIQNRYYYIVNNIHSNANNTKNYIVVSEEENDNIKTLTTIESPFPQPTNPSNESSVETKYSEWMNIIDDSEQYIFAYYIAYGQFYRSGYLNVQHLYIVRINKETFAVSNVLVIKDTGRPIVNTFYKSTDNFCCVITNGVNNAHYYPSYADGASDNLFTKHTIIRINKSTFAAETQVITPQNIKFRSGSYSAISNVTWYNENVYYRINSLYIDDFYKNGNDYYYFSLQKTGLKNPWYKDIAYDGICTGVANLCLRRLTPTNAFSNFHAYNTYVGGTWDSGQQQKWLTPYGSTISWNDSIYTIERYWLIGNYMYFAVYNENAESGMLNYQGIHVMQIKTDGSAFSAFGIYLNYLSKIAVSNSKNIISMVYNSDKSILLIGFKNEFEIWKLNTSSHLYEKTSMAYTNIKCAGFDSLDRIWYMTGNSGVHYLSLTDPIKAKIKFEKQFYIYSNENIESYITFEATDAFDNNANGNYILTLSGPAYFKSNNKKQLTIEYTGNNSAHYPIVINGPETISCAAKFQKVWEV